MTKMTFCSIEDALKRLKAGKMIILVDDEGRENEGDLVMAAEFVTPEAINFMAQHARGLICLPLHASIVDKLQLKPMTHDNQTAYQTAFTVSIEAREGVATGISASDRAHTIRTAINVDAKPDDLIQPGHVFPLRAATGGVLQRVGHTEGSVDLVEIAGLVPAAVICEIMAADGTMARQPELAEFSKQHDIPIVKIKDLITYRWQHEILVEEVAETKIPLEPYGDFLFKVFQNRMTGQEQVVLIKPFPADEYPLVRVHSSCVTGDIFGSKRCDCGKQLELSMQMIAKQGGLLIYLNQEGRGIGLTNKIKAYALQDEGLDTVEANHKLGFAADLRNYIDAAQILRSLGLTDIHLLTNNPNKVNDLTRFGVKVHDRLPLMSPNTKQCHAYLKTKRDKLGHLLELD